MPIVRPQDKSSSRDEDVDLEENRDLEGEEEEYESSSTSSHKKVQFIIIGIVAVIIAVAAFMLSGGKDKPESSEVSGIGDLVNEENTETNSNIPVNNDKPWLTGGNEVKPPANGSDTQTSPEGGPVGIKDISGNNITENPHKISKDDLTKTFTGKESIPNYRISRITKTADFVSYKMHRTTVSEGLEMYWLDAEYKGKKAIITVPFEIAKEMDPVGVTVVDVETTEIINDQGEIDYMVTGFTVRTDYKKLLEGR